MLPLLHYTTFKSTFSLANTGRKNRPYPKVPDYCRKQCFAIHVSLLILISIDVVITFSIWRSQKWIYMLLIKGMFLYVRSNFSDSYKFSIDTLSCITLY